MIKTIAQIRRISRTSPCSPSAFSDSWMIIRSFRVIRLPRAIKSSVARVKAQAADLDQRDDHDLAKEAEVFARLHHDEPRHAHAGRSGKKGLQQVGLLARSQGYGQHQKRGAGHNDQGEAQYDNLGGGGAEPSLLQR